MSTTLSNEAIAATGPAGPWSLITWTCGHVTSEYTPTGVQWLRETAFAAARPCVECRLAAPGAAEKLRQALGGSGVLARLVFCPRCQACDASVLPTEATRGTDGAWTCTRCAEQAVSHAG